MIYVCLVTRNDRPTVGLVLWKLRKLFAELAREYQILIADDASRDDTPATLAVYQKALPLTLVTHDAARGYAASIEELLRLALSRSDRPRRDLAITLPPDFTASPVVVPEIVRRFESGADLVVGEAPRDAGPFSARLLRRCAAWLLKPGVAIPGVRDLTSGVVGIRLITLRRCLEQRPGLLETDGPPAHAELVARLACAARQVVGAPIPPSPSAVAVRATENPLAAAVSLFRAGRRLRIPAPPPPAARL